MAQGNPKDLFCSIRPFADDSLVGDTDKEGFHSRQDLSFLPHRQLGLSRLCLNAGGPLIDEMLQHRGIPPNFQRGKREPAQSQQTGESDQRN